MPRWTTILEDHLRAAGHGRIVESAREQDPGAIDPVSEAIADAVARVRRAASTGNRLDANAGAVPNSLKAVTIRLAMFALCELIGLPLSEDQKETKRNDISDLKRLSDEKMGVEKPDTVADGAGEIQKPASFATVQEGNSGNSRRIFGGYEHRPESHARGHAAVGGCAAGGVARGV